MLAHLKKMMYENELTPPPPLWNFSIKNIPFFKWWLPLAWRAGHYVDSPHSLTLWKWLIAQRGADTVVWWMADANHKFCCVVTPQSALLPQSRIVHTWNHTFACWLLKEDILWRENCFSGKIEKKETFKFAKPMLSCCIVRFLEARSSHYGWSCDSPHWPSEQPCIVIDIGKVLTESIHVWTWLQHLCLGI